MAEPLALECGFAQALVATIIQVEAETGRPWSVISGFRSEAEQEELRRQGRPTAPPGCSTHTRCPATGADLRVSGFPAAQYKVSLGVAAVMNGLRWGGGSSRDPETGIPADWNHVDAGPVC